MAADCRRYWDAGGWCFKTVFLRICNVNGGLEAAATEVRHIFYLRSGGVHAAIAFFPFLYFPIPVHTAAEAIAAEGSRCFTASCSMTLSAPARAIIASSLSA